MDQTSWIVLSSVSAAGAAIAALIATWINHKTFKNELEKDRPFIGFPIAGLIDVELPNNRYKIQIHLVNFGKIPALNVKTKVVALDTSLQNTLDFNEETEIGNELLPNIPSPWQSDIWRFSGPNISPRFVVIGVTYTDLKNRLFKNIMYAKWNGLNNGQGERKFFHASIEEIKTLKTYLKDELKDYLD